MSITSLLQSLGVSPQVCEGGGLAVRSPIDGNTLAHVPETPTAEVGHRVERAHAAFLRWRQVPAPQLGELVRLLGETLRTHKQALGELVTLEVGKITSEGQGEVQALFECTCQRFSHVEQAHDLLQLMIGTADVSQALAADTRVTLVSATGSTRMGRNVAQAVASRLGRSLLELGGNNAIIVTPSADLALAVRGVAFSALGTAGQRCTSARRLLVHASVYDEFLKRLKHAYASVQIGDPREADTLLGPLIDQHAFDAMQAALVTATEQGGQVTGGERVLQERYPNAYYVRAALVELPTPTDLVRQETFAPILYVLPYQTLAQAIALNNDVPQGLSSAIFTTDLREAEAFMSATGSDCGIANVNIGTSGAEIGGAFGGEKDTGGGRESGSDAWKAYMRRATNTVNYSSALPLAQGVRFMPSAGEAS